MPPFRVHQELAAIGGNGRAEMVGHGLMHAELCDHAKRGGKIDAKLMFVRGQGGFRHPSLLHIANQAAGEM
jgi:hypothetical protein